MKIVVCIKQVPATTNVRIDPETNALIREGVESQVNPFDENALEAALQVKDGYDGECQVIALTMGPPQAEAALRDAVAMGCDDAILLTDGAFRGADTLATSYTLAQAIRRIGDVDLVLCGKQAIDGDTAQVGPGVAEHLGVPQITFAIELSLEGRKITAKRMLEDSFEVVECRMPAVVTVVKQINDPRRASMKNVLKARKREITRWTAEDIDADPDRIGFQGSPTVVWKVFAPEGRKGGRKLEGEVGDVVHALADEILEIRKGLSTA
ncbi:MAG: electron transfer flavoprotein subunit beta/FixA family protein [Armatimonadetes bacterium]|nr:electron transfer flavoprotein subunit beta/FixA family protein [Armatimonadota bacterium]MDI9602661.1 electron transfer flavoprotein subunit beta/FixA family protein [Acidobacteriota bacterium]NLN89200.1 electron transfer flavoprotein subunit beta/FixA family protein [candidate division WS1 bacterium]